MKVKSFLAGMLTMALLIGSVGTAHAIVGTKTINADYQNITIKIDGDPIVPKDAQGTYVEPFAIEGTTYLPVRAVAEALGIGVEWDADTSTVCLQTDMNQSGEIWTTLRMLECTEALYNTFFVGIECCVYAGSSEHNYERVLKLQEHIEASKNNYERVVNDLELYYYPAIPQDCENALRKATDCYGTLIDDVDNLIYWFGVLSSKQHPASANDEYTAAVNKMLNDYKEGRQYCITFSSEFIKAL